MIKLQPTALVPIVILASAVGASRLAAADFYQGKQIRIIVGNTSGGGFDDHARLLAQHLGSHIPGNPTVITENMPGAATLKSVQYLSTSAPQDGTVMTIFNPNLIMESLTDSQKIAVDFTKLHFIGSATQDVRVCYTWYTTGLETFEDVLKANQIVMGATAQSSNSRADSAILKNVFGAKIKLVMGYPGSTEQYLAVERGELMGGCGSWSSIPADWIKEKKAVPFVRYSQVVLEGMPPLPYILDKARTEEEREVLKLILAPSEMGRPYVVGPNVPADRIEILRSAFDEAMQDKSFLADAAKRRIEITGPMSGAEMESIVKNLYATPASAIAQVASALN